MRLDMNIFQIAAKYAANLMGIATPEEREALENWNQESVWHTNLAERLDQEEDFKANQLWEDVPGRGGGGNMLLSF